MRQHVDTVDDRIAQGFVGVVDTHLRAKAPPPPLVATSCHFGEVFQVILDTVFTMLGGDTIHALLAHLFLLGVIGVCLAGFDHLQREFVQLIEVVGRVRDRIAANVEEGEILQDSLFEFSLQRRVSMRLIPFEYVYILTRSLEGFVSSKRMIIFPLYIFAKYWLSIAAFAWPM